MLNSRPGESPNLGSILITSGPPGRLKIPGGAGVGRTEGWVCVGRSRPSSLQSWRYVSVYCTVLFGTPCLQRRERDNLDGYHPVGPPTSAHTLRCKLLAKPPTLFTTFEITWRLRSCRLARQQSPLRLQPSRVFRPPLTVHMIHQKSGGSYNPYRYLPPSLYVLVMISTDVFLASYPV